MSLSLRDFSLDCCLLRISLFEGQLPYASVAKLIRTSAIGFTTFIFVLNSFDFQSFVLNMIFVFIIFLTYINVDSPYISSLTFSS